MGARAFLPLGALFAPTGAGEALSYGASTDSPAPLGVRIDGGRLVLDANDEGAEGTARVTVTAVDPYGQSSSRTFPVIVEWVPAGSVRNWRLEWMRRLRRDFCAGGVADSGLSFYFAALVQWRVRCATSATFWRRSPSGWSGLGRWSRFLTP